MRIALPNSDEVLLLSPRWGDWADPTQMAAVVLGLVALAALMAWLFRWEARLIRRGTAGVLLGLRVLVLILLWFIACFQPMLVREHVEMRPGQVLVAVDMSQSMDLADPGSPEGQTRAAIASRILSDEGGALLKRLRADHEVEVVTFASSLGEWTEGKTAVSAVGPSGTDLRLPLERALQPARTGVPRLGVILLSDGRHNVGEEPLALAARLGRHQTPLFPIALGAGAALPDLALTAARTPATALRGNDFSMQVEARVSALPAQDLVVEVMRKGQAKPLAQKLFKHPGNDRPDARPATYPLSIAMKIEEVGTQQLDVRLRPAAGAVKEVTMLNNEHPAVVRVVQDRPRVLLIDGAARWEHHYLATFLSRVPDLQVDQVLFEQPRLGLLKEEKLEKLGFAAARLPVLKDKGDDPLFTYDCIVLGDVAPDDLGTLDRERLNRYVGQRGGTLVMISGKRYMPLAFDARKPSADPIWELLPVTDVAAETSKEGGFGVALTEMGRASPWLALGDDPAQSEKLWADLPPHFWALTGKPKPAATVLAQARWPKAAKGQPERGLIVQQNFGLGRVLWSGLESTWRWRKGVGDLHHHRFWGQVVLWAATKELLPAGAVDIRFGSRQPVYAPDQDVDLALRLGPDVALPKDPPALRLIRILPEGKEEPVADLALTASAGQPRLFEVKRRDLQEGRYRLEPILPSLQDRVREALADKTGDPTFTVLPRLGKEMLDPSSDWELLRRLARESGGSLHEEGTVDELLRGLERRVQRKEHRHEQRFWRDPPFVWWLFGAVLSLLSFEWLGRKWVGLP